MENLNVIAPNVVWSPRPSAIEGGRRPTEIDEGRVAAAEGPAIVAQMQVPRSEVIAKKPRRKFSVDYKLRILRELEACQNCRERGLILRREGLYSSTVSNWKKSCREGALKMLSTKRGRKSEDPAMRRIAELEKENVALRKKLKQAETIIDVQKKVSEMFGVSVNESIQDDQK